MQRLWDKVCDPAETDLFREEIWSVDRCGQTAEFSVKYFKEGGDGFSTYVWPRGLLDKWNALKYYLFE